MYQCSPAVACMVAATEPMQRVRQLPTRVFHFYMRFSDPTPLRSPISSPSAQGCHSTYKTHGLRRQIIALINHRLFTQRALAQSNSLCLTSDVRCFRSPPPLRFLRPIKHDGSVGYGSRTSVIRSFSEVSTAA